MNFDETRNYTKGLLKKSFSNKNVLDKLSEDDDGNILFNGSSISGKSIIKAELVNNELIVDYSDGTSKNLGTLNATVSVSGDFVTSEGFFNIRYYNNKFQYYDEGSSTWIDIQATTNNAIFVDLKPATMKKMSAVNNPDNLGEVSLYLEGQDVIVNGQAICFYDYAKIVRKLGSAPENETDGDLVLTINRKNMTKYSKTPYTDAISNAQSGQKYYYKAFVHGTSGLVNDLSECSVEVKDYILFGYSVDSDESDPSSAVSYDVDYVDVNGITKKVDNVEFESAHMDYTLGKFNYGSWKNAFFMPRPCMLKSDGTVDYYLNENNYTKKEDGTDSDVANASYDGNAMMEWGRNGKRIWYKIVGTNTDNTSYNVYFCDKQLDTDFVAWSFYNKNDVLGDHFYTPIYSGSLVDSKLRSLSDKSIKTSVDGSSEIIYAKNNGESWNTEVWSDKLLMFLLLYLMGKSLDLQTTYGRGHDNGSGLSATGQLNTYGLFYGYSTDSQKVKVFGMEDQWGEQLNRVCGLILSNDILYVKYTEGTIDGTTVDSYRQTDSNGMISLGNAPASGFVSKMVSINNSIIPYSTNGSSSTYYCNRFLKASGTCYAAIGGWSDSENDCGFYINISDPITQKYWAFGATLSCKPILQSS